MSIAIIGDGFIGRSIAKAMVTNNEDVFLISRNSSHKIAGVSCLVFPELGTLGSTHFMDDIIHDVDVVVNAAWINYREVNSIHNLSDNLPFQMELINYILKAGKRLINLGSAYEYGFVTGSIVETHECKPITTYGVVKNILQIYSFERAKFSSGSILWLRIFNVMGDPPAKGTFFHLLDEAIQSDQKIFKMSRGDQLRDYIDVCDLSALVAQAYYKKLSGVYNLASGNPISMFDLACTYAQNKGSKITIDRGAIPIPRHESLAYWANTSKLTNALKR
ncbi:NAD(P)-dependent oxidoreductase [bacterium]|jgi:nucleoside-diphosphate-sugar epimerase|nr:NAD(P)-dependent oxidoreductase [bacterium]